MRDNVVVVAATLAVAAAVAVALAGQDKGDGGLRPLTCRLGACALFVRGLDNTTRRYFEVTTAIATAGAAGDAVVRFELASAADAKAWMMANSGTAKTTNIPRGNRKSEPPPPPLRRDRHSPVTSNRRDKQADRKRQR